MQEVLDSGAFILGQNVEKLERTISRYCQCDYGLGVASGTDALLLCLMALNIGADDEVITTPFSFFATAGAICRVRAKPVFVDIDEDTFNIDASKIDKYITNKTKAIIPVHLFGYPADMSIIMEIARSYNLFVIEDVAQAIGARIFGKKVGSFGNAAAISFFPTKNLGAFGDGGMMVTNAEYLFHLVDIFRRQGATNKNFHEVIGINSRLDELQAAILNVKFKYLESWIEKRREVANNYYNLLNCTNNIILPVVKDGFFHVFHQYSIRIENDRDGFRHFLSSNGIETTIYYPYPLHLQPAFKGLGYKIGDFPVCEKTCNQIVSLPCYPDLSLTDQEYVSNIIKDYKTIS